MKTYQIKGVKKMREIKFRAWHGIGGDETNGMTMTYWKLGSGLDNSVFFHNAKAVMQFTGLKDKNGKEVYEGDILEVINGMEGEIGVVEWATLNWDINWNYAKNLGKYDYDLTCKDSLEIIGNIYEHSHLLNK